MNDESLLELTRAWLEAKAQSTERQRIVNLNIQRENWARERAQVAARENLLQSIVGTIVRDALVRIAKERIAGDAIVRLSARKRLLGFLWHYTATDKQEHVCWYIGHRSTTEARYFVCDDGTIGMAERNSNIHMTGHIDHKRRASILRQLWMHSKKSYRPTSNKHTILATTTRTVLRATFPDPAFDNMFCREVLGEWFTNVEAELDLDRPPI